MKGMFGLMTFSDLFGKLEWEYQQFFADPGNPYHAYNFFVTAWHLLEWKYPDEKDAGLRKSIRDQNDLLKVCEHLAVGAKHFQPDPKRHKSVSDTKKDSVWSVGVWADNAWKDNSWTSWLTVELSDDAEKHYGTKVKAHELAQQVMDFWRVEIQRE